MGTKPHYFRIGLFVIVAVALLLVAVVVWGVGMVGREHILFETYIDGSVHGLQVGSPVEYSGVEVGRVKQITFVPNHYPVPADPYTLSRFERCVMVIVSVRKQFFPALAGEQAADELQRLIDNGLRMRLSSQILTGVAYLEISYADPYRFPVTRIGWTPRHLYLPSAPGAVTTLKDSVDRVLARLQEIDIQSLSLSIQEVFTSLRQTVNDANIPELTADARSLLAEARRKVEQLDTDRISREAAEVLVALRKTVEDANVPALSSEARELLVQAGDVTKSLQGLLAKPEAGADLANLSLAVAQLNRTLQRFDSLVARQTPQIEQTLDNFRQVSETLRDLLTRLEQYPSGILFSKPPAKPETLK